MAVSRFDIDAPRWDQSTFIGRLKHFVNITDWRTALLVISTVVVPYDENLGYVWFSCSRAASLPPGTTEEQLHYAKKLYDSAFHPDTGNCMNLIGRMSFQVPGGMAITGVPAVVFWQNAASPITSNQIGVAYLTATRTALATAVGLNLYTKKAPPLVAPSVPFAAVASANCVNIPMMRQQELLNGIALTDENGNKLGHSKKAAVKGITQVVISQVTMAAPGMSSVRGLRGRAVEFEISPHSIDNGKWSVILLLPTMTHSSPSSSTCHSFIYFLSSCAPSLLSPSLLLVILPIIMQRLEDNKFMQVGL
uniref:Sideroflexin 2 n=1 Tax=Oncorhynchus kisutch TaxID=8019 RepID=A0A8C7DKY3_ONCKI